MQLKANLGDKLVAHLERFRTRLVNEEIGRAAKRGQPVVRFATADTIEKVEGWPKKPSPEMEALLKEAARQKVKNQEMDEFWKKAAEEHAGKSTNPEVISYEEARKMGLTPDSKK
jgi:hypothetical protein